MTRKEIMTKAHEIARTLEGDYSARISMALEIVWKMDLVSDMSLVNIQSCLNNRSFCFDTAVLEIVSFFSTGFQADIANKSLENEYNLSIKQAWCVAYEYKKVA